MLDLIKNSLPEEARLFLESRNALLHVDEVLQIEKSVMISFFTLKDRRNLNNLKQLKLNLYDAYRDMESQNKLEKIIKISSVNIKQLYLL